MQINHRQIISVILIFFFNSAQAADTGKHLMLMHFKFMGALGEAKLDDEHVQRLKMANAELRKQLVATGQSDLADEAATAQFNQQVNAALKNNACDNCELTLAKAQGIQRILYPWVYKLSNLVLSLHVVTIDVTTNKTLVKKVHDFRGDNDQSWRRAIEYFVKYSDQP
jgi:hypothetical protein